VTRPLLLGHRGLRLPGEPRENTLAAFDRALQLGCDGFEFDVRSTADQHAVICHDPHYHNKEVASTNAVNLQGICTLDEVLERYKSRIFLDIELKVPGLERRIVSMLEEAKLQSEIVISSFYPNILTNVRTVSRNAALGFICDRASALAHWRELPVDYLMPHLSLLTRELLDEMHTAKKKVIVWTVNNPNDMKRLSEWGVDGLISDNPALLVCTVRDHKL
jgi:glycerophosphoryl diester phosphodiesterase